MFFKYPGSIYNPDSGFCESFPLINCNGQLAEKNGKLICYADIDEIVQPRQEDTGPGIFSSTWNWIKNLFKNAKLI